MLTKTKMTEKARILRRNATKAEDFLWIFLKNRYLNRYKFRRQHAIGPYIIDFVCERKKLIIELDGSQHAEIKNEEYDKKRTLFLEAHGYKVLRFWNSVVFTEIEGVLETILNALDGVEY